MNNNEGSDQVLGNTRAFVAMVWNKCGIDTWSWIIFERKHLDEGYTVRVWCEWQKTWSNTDCCFWQNSLLAVVSLIWAAQEYSPWREQPREMSRLGESLPSWTCFACSLRNNISLSNLFKRTIFNTLLPLKLEEYYLNTRDPDMSETRHSRDMGDKRDLESRPSPPGYAGAATAFAGQPKRIPTTPLYGTISTTCFLNWTPSLSQNCKLCLEATPSWFRAWLLLERAQEQDWEGRNEKTNEKGKRYRPPVAWN